MSTENNTYVGLPDRLQVLVELHADGNAKKFAETAGIGSATFYNYLKGRVPPADALSNICATYKVSMNWLVLGVGNQQLIDDELMPPLDPDPEIAQLMEGARRVLTSGNPIAFDALERNIRYFDHAIEAERRADQMEKQILDMKEDFELIKSEMQRLRRENLRLDKEAEEQSSNKKVA